MKPYGQRALHPDIVYIFVFGLAAISFGFTEAAQLRHGSRSSHAAIEEPPLFLTEDDVPSYRAAISKYLAVGGCFGESRDSMPRRLSFGTCAVVGASPNSEASRAGREIDGHVAVFRAGICDRATLRNYSEDIGEKTTYCVSFSAKKDLARDTKLIMPLTTWQFLRNIEPTDSSSTCKDRYMLVHPRQMSRWDARLYSLSSEIGVDISGWRNRSIYSDPHCLASSIQNMSDPSKCPSILDLSSGFDAVLLALDLCRSVDVYGFDTDYSTDAPYGHLHNNVTSVHASCKMKDHSHPFPLERRLLKAWNERGVLSLHSSTLLPSKRGRHTQACDP